MRRAEESSARSIAVTLPADLWPAVLKGLAMAADDLLARRREEGAAYVRGIRHGIKEQVDAQLDGGAEADGGSER